MKRTVCAVLCAIMVIFSGVQAFAAKNVTYSDNDNGYSVRLPQGYTVIDRYNLSDNKDFIEKIGYSVPSFRNKMNQSDIYMYAADEENRHQVQLRIWESDFSEEVGLLSALSDDQLKTALDTMSASLGDSVFLLGSRVYKKGELAFLVYDVKAGDSFCYREYLTVVNSDCYALIYYNSSDTFDDAESKQADIILDSLSVSVNIKGDKWSKYGLTLRIFSTVVIVAAAAGAVYIIYTFIRDFRRRKNAPESIPDHIQMKYK